MSWPDLRFFQVIKEEERESRDSFLKSSKDVADLFLLDPFPQKNWDGGSEVHFTLIWSKKWGRPAPPWPIGRLHPCQGYFFEAKTVG